MSKSKMRVNKKTKESIDAYLFLLPALLIIFVFIIYPGIKLFAYSLTNLRLMGNGDFVGLKNFIKIFSSHSFLRSLTVSLSFMIIVVIVQTSLALFAAVQFNKEAKHIGISRTLCYLPVILSFVVVGYLWKGLYNVDFGLINAVLSSLGLPSAKFLDDANQALSSLIVACIWKTWPFFMMIFIAGLKEIPQSIYESADIDGANSIKQFFYITLPMIRKTLLFVIVITTMDSVVKVFSPVYIMTSGGPMNSTDMVVFHTWRTAFRLGKLGEASAMAVVLFVFVLIINIIQLKIGETDE